VTYDDEFYKSLSSIKQLNDNHLINGTVASFGNFYLFYYYQQVRPPGVQMDLKTMDSLAIRRIINENKDNAFLARLAITDKVKSSLAAKTISFVDKEKTLLTELYQGSVLKDPIFEAYEKVKTQIDNPQLSEDIKVLTFKSEDAEDYLSEIIENANGKVIYIDNWATWCAPCRSQFKYHTPEFKKKYGEDVEFVYLCYESKEAQWKPMIADYNLTGKHYFITDSDLHILGKKVRLEGYPTYTIIDKKGKIAYSGFKYRPSEAITSEVIDELLK
ncbi:MAG: TlpA disulfide reductase family protein, partial [Bacteroidota bacterium]